MYKIDLNPNRFLATAILCVASLAIAADEEPSGASPHRLQMRATAPPVRIEPGNSERRELQLPALDVDLGMQAQCGESFSAEMLSLTIADSRLFLDSGDLNASSDLDEIRLTVPANQLAPIILTDFCRSTTGENSPPAELTPSTSLTVNAILSASAALLCRSEDDQQMIYAATPLDIMLVCERSESATDIAE